jgi:hypothetical protein
VLAAAAIGLPVMVALVGYRYRITAGAPFEQARYLFPAIPIWGLLVAVAARSAGRYGPALGMLLVTLLAGHELMSMLFVIGRYYG